MSIHAVGDRHIVSHLPGTWVNISPMTLLICKQWGMELVLLLSGGSSLSSFDSLSSGTDILAQEGFHSVAIGREK